jgi:hypothetical protein
VVSWIGVRFRVLRLFAGLSQTRATTRNKAIASYDIPKLGNIHCFGFVGLLGSKIVRISFWCLA